MNYKDCRECGAMCCKFISIALDETDEELDPHPERFFELHENIRVVKTRYGREIVILTRCKALREDNTCGIYNDRPDMCRNFDERHIHRYCVPKGCKYDPEGLYGEDYGVE